MFAVYSNLKTCVENLGETGRIDSYIAHFILENHQQIPAMSIEQLSQACNTSQASISRFCQRVNSSNFKTLKEQISEYNAYLQREVTRSPKHQELSRHTYFKLLDMSLEQTKQLLTFDILHQAVRWLDAAKNIYFFGSSFSNNVAKDGCEKFVRINRLCFSFSSVKSQLSAVNLIRSDDLVILVTFSGTNRHIHKLYRKIRQKHCRIIWISANRTAVHPSNEMVVPISPLALEAYETALIEGINLRVAIDLIFLAYTDHLRNTQLM